MTRSSRLRCRTDVDRLSSGIQPISIQLSANIPTCFQLYRTDDFNTVRGNVLSE